MCASGAFKSHRRLHLVSQGLGCNDQGLFAWWRGLCAKERACAPPAHSNPIAGSRFYKGFRVLSLRPFFHLVSKPGQIRAVLLAKSRQFGGWGAGRGMGLGGLGATVAGWEVGSIRIRETSYGIGINSRYLWMHVVFAFPLRHHYQSVSGHCLRNGFGLTRVGPVD